MDWVERQAPEISACSRKCARERSECRLRVTRILSREALTQGLRGGRRAMLDHRCKTWQAVVAEWDCHPFSDARWRGRVRHRNAHALRSMVCLARHAGEAHACLQECRVAAGHCFISAVEDFFYAALHMIFFRRRLEGGL